MKFKFFQSPKEGFTLIETLVGIAITGILAALAMPSFVSWLENKKVDNALTMLEGAVKEAQATSIRRNQACTVTITSTSISATPSNCLPTGSRTLANSSTNLAVAVTNNSVSFTNKGSTLDTEPFIIYRTNNETNYGKMKCLVVSAGIGMIRTGTYNDTSPTTIPASLGAAPTQSSPPTAAEAAAYTTWNDQATARNATITTVVNKCVS